MPRATRTFETDLAELEYQLGRSEGVERIARDLHAGEIDDQEAQSRLMELLERGHCRVQGDRGGEEWSFVLNEAELSRLANALYRERIGGP